MSSTRRTKSASSSPPASEMPFPPLEDTPLDDPEIVALRDAAAHPPVDLSAHDPGLIGGHMLSPSPMGAAFPFATDPTFASGSVGGRPSAPRIWASALLHENVAQLRVWRKVNGVPVLIGVIDKDATEEDFIRTFFESMPKPGEGDGRYIIRPIDRDGNEIREEISLPPISEHHTLLRQMRASNAPAVVPIPQGNPLQDTMLQFVLSRAESAEKAAQAERDAVKAESSRLAALNIEAAQRGAMSLEAITERMMAAEQRRAEQAQGMEAARSDQMLQMMRAQADATAADFRQRQAEDAARRDAELRALESRMKADRDDMALRLERERMEAQVRMERERAEYDRRWERERAENEARIAREMQERADRQRREDQLLEIRREAEARAAAAAENERQRQHEARMKEMEQAAQRAREDADRRLQQEREYQERLVRLTLEGRHADTLEGTLEKVTGTLTKLGIDPKALVSGFLAPQENGPPVAEVLGSVLTAGLGTLGQYLQSRSEVERARVNATVRAAAQSPMPTPLLPAPNPVVSGGDILFGQAQNAPVAAPQPAGTQAPPAKPPEEVTGPPGSESLPLQVRKDARQAFRRLAKTINSEPQDVWRDATIHAYQDTPAMYHYAKAATLRAALVEGGVQPAYIDIYLAHAASGVFPNDIPRGG